MIIKSDKKARLSNRTHKNHKKKQDRPTGTQQDKKIATRNRFRTKEPRTRQKKNIVRHKYDKIEVEIFKREMLL